MNDGPIQQFKQDTENILLSETEKSAMRERLFAFMHDNPAPAPSPSWMHVHLHRAAFAYALGFLLIVTVPSVYASGKSLPGDILYPLKVNIIEPTTEFLSFDSETHASRITTHSEERLWELVQLLTDAEHAERVAIVSEELEDTTQRAQKYLRGSSNISLEERLDIQKDVLTVLEAHEILSTGFSDDPQVGDTLTSERLLLEDELIETINLLADATNEEEVLAHIEDSVEALQEKIESPITDEERALLEKGITQTLSELSDGDTDGALRAITMYEQDADVIGLIQNLTASSSEALGESVDAKIPITEDPK